MDRRETRDALAAELKARADALAAAVAEFNRAAAESFARVQAAADGYNAAVRAADAFRDATYDALAGRYEARSERWQDGPKGKALAARVEAWGEPLEEVELYEPDPLDAPDCEAPAAFDALP